MYPQSTLYKEIGRYIRGTYDRGKKNKSKIKLGSPKKIKNNEK